MKRTNQIETKILPVLFILSIIASTAQAVIPGVTGTEFFLEAKSGQITGGDGMTLLAWGYALEGAPMQYPGPTLILQQGDEITINLQNNLHHPVSMVFPGLHPVTASSGGSGYLTREAMPGSSVRYSFVADKPGTFLYHSGTNPDLQVEMGLVGAIIVRPALGVQYAYNDEDTYFDREYLFLETEMDLEIHRAVELGCDNCNTNDFFPVYWFLNGRNAPDTLAPSMAQWLPHQPYNCMPRMHPGEKILLRFISAGRDAHPFHTHGNHFQVIARNSFVLDVPGGGGTDLSELHFTFSVPPGETADAVFEWTGAGLGWDIYGHQHDIDNLPLGNFPGEEDIDHNGDGIMDLVPEEPFEDPNDHGKPFPVALPEPTDITYGNAWSGSPFLGTMGYLPPDHPHFNLTGAYLYMWHSHNEKEMVNNDIFPGGMMTMLIIEHHDVFIP
ncbi:multicopper oxidase domain-containing protein [bacterium]|nr:multicopper oxidase domain-containing protein [candidate division CSSED10-310 bacterium]